MNHDYTDHERYIMKTSYIYAASHANTCATQKPHYLHHVHQPSVKCASIIVMLCALTTSMVMEAATPPDEGDEFIETRTGLNPMLYTIYYTQLTSLLLAIMFMVGQLSPWTSHVINPNRLPLLQGVTHRNAPEVNWSIGRIYCSAGTYYDPLRMIPPSELTRNTDDVTDVYTLLIAW